MFKQIGKFLLMAAIAITLSMGVTGCQTDANVASYNLSKEAEMFRIDRRIVFINGITGDHLLSIDGKCSIEDADRQLEVTCKTGPNAFKKHFLGLSDNVTYVAEQLDSVGVSVYRSKIIFKPTLIGTNVEVNAGM